MSELYTVTIVTPVTIKRIEGKNAVVGTKDEYTVQEYKNCSWDQVLFYRKTFLSADITIMQTGGFKDRAKNRVKFADVKGAAAARVDARKFEGKAARKSDTPYAKPVKEEAPAVGTDYAAVINRMMDEAR